MRESASGNFRRKRHVRDMRNRNRIFVASSRQSRLVSSDSATLKSYSSFFAGYPRTAGVSNDRRTRLMSTRTRPGKIAAISIRPAATPFTSSSSEAKAIGRIRMRVQTLTAFHWRTCRLFSLSLSRNYSFWLLARSTPIFQPLDPHSA